MKKYIVFTILFTVLLVFQSTEIFAGAFNTLTVSLDRKELIEPQDGPDYDPPIHRFETEAVGCTITRGNGVEISGTTDEIIAYEIWDATGSVCIGYFTDEEEFVEYLFSLNGEFRIILFYSDCILTGEVSLK
ncbi:MAG: hypothetical protein K2J65_03785 [Duncaniella sp.]|nr:hypothetical protein [Duncaniella sp.]